MFKISLAKTGAATGVIYFKKIYNSTKKVNC